PALAPGALPPPPVPLDRFGGGSVGTGITSFSSTSKGYSLTRTEAIRDTYFASGPADRYAGEYTINVSIRRTVNPSRLLDTALLGVPRLVSDHTQGVSDRNRERPSVDVPMIERVLIPSDMLHDDVLPPAREPAAPAPAPAQNAVANAAPKSVADRFRAAFGLQPPNRPQRPVDRNVAVQEVAAGSGAAALGDRPFGITPRDLLQHDVVNYGFDHTKLRVLFDEAMKRFSGTTASVNGEGHSSAVARLTDDGTRAQDALHYLLSFPMLTRQLEHILSPQGLTSPELVREGGVFTDTTGTLTVRMELANPHVRGYSNGWLESVDYGFLEFNRNESHGSGLSLNINAGTSATSGDLTGGQPANSHRHQSAGDAVNLTLGRNTGDNNFAVLKNMPKAEAYLRQVPWLRVNADAIVHLTLNARNTRGAIDLPGGRVTLSFRVAKALELGLPPETALAHGLAHPRGLPTPSGLFVAAHGADPAHGAPDHTLPELITAYNRPADGNLFFLHVRTTGDGRFVVGGETMNAAAFHQRVLAGRDLAGRTIVLVADGGNRPVPGRGTAAEALAQLTDRPVLATAGTVHVTPDGAIIAGADPGAPGRAGNRGAWDLVTMADPLQVAPHTAHGAVLDDAIRSTRRPPPQGGGHPQTHSAKGKGSETTIPELRQRVDRLQEELNTATALRNSLADAPVNADEPGHAEQLEAQRAAAQADVDAARGALTAARQRLNVAESRQKAADAVEAEREDLRRRVAEDLNRPPRDPERPGLAGLAGLGEGVPRRHDTVEELPPWTRGGVPAPASALGGGRGPLKRSATMPLFRPQRGPDEQVRTPAAPPGTQEPSRAQSPVEVASPLDLTRAPTPHDEGPAALPPPLPLPSGMEPLAPLTPAQVRAIEQDQIRQEFDLRSETLKRANDEQSELWHVRERARTSGAAGGSTAVDDALARAITRARDAERNLRTAEEWAESAGVLVRPEEPTEPQDTEAVTAGAIRFNEPSASQLPPRHTFPPTRLPTPPPYPPPLPVLPLLLHGSDDTDSTNESSDTSDTSDSGDQSDHGDQGDQGGQS
ncbi:hypothetical protein, partial [Catenulispora rubra]|uniref:hypothetical protein n=1 Tax=Catenulispora rubra TaxID=280293 RepID=UPI001891F343